MKLIKKGYTLSSPLHLCVCVGVGVLMTCAGALIVCLLCHLHNTVNLQVTLPFVAKSKAES